MSLLIQGAYIQFFEHGLQQIAILRGCQAQIGFAKLDGETALFADRRLAVNSAGISSKPAHRLNERTQRNAYQELTTAQGHIQLLQVEFEDIAVLCDRSLQHARL